MFILSHHKTRLVKKKSFKCPILILIFLGRLIIREKERGRTTDYFAANNNDYGSRAENGVGEYW